MMSLLNVHLEPNIHLSQRSIGSATLKTSHLGSLRNKGPQANSETDIDVRAAAAMCQYAYHVLNPGAKNKIAELIDGWKPMYEQEVNSLVAPGFYQKLKRDISGFSSMLFHKEADGIQYYAYCTEGTDMTSIKDWFSNISQGLVGFSPQYTYSVQIAQQLDRAIGNTAVLWFIGHSLGGGLAANNSLVTGRHAITFNAAGLNPLRVNATLALNNWKELFHPIQRTQRVHAFVVEDEILNFTLKWIGQSAYGTKKTVTLNQKNLSKFKRHGLTNFLDKWGIRYYQP